MHDISNVIAAILAGGFGTRLYSVMTNRPKVLVEIHGRPFLEYLLCQLSYWGIRNVVLCTGYLGEQIQSRFGDSYGNLRLIYSNEPTPLGTAGALRRALPRFKSDSILVLNGDSYCKTDLKSFWNWHYIKKSEATLLLTKNSDTKRYGKVQINNNGQILKFDEKDEKNGPGWINTGIYFFKHRFINSISENGPVSLEREIFPSWVGRGLYGYKSKGQFLDIGTQESYALAEQFITEDILK